MYIPLLPVCFLLLCFSFSRFLLLLVPPLSPFPRFVDTVVMNGLPASSTFASFSLCDGSPYSFMECDSQYGRYLDAHRFGAMRVVGDQPSIYDLRFDKYRDTAVVAWIKSRSLCEGRGAGLLECVHESKNVSFVWCYEEVNCERPLVPIVAMPWVAGDGSFLTSLREIVGLSCQYDN